MCEGEERVVAQVCVPPVTVETTIGQLLEITPSSHAHEAVAALIRVARSKTMFMIDPNANHPRGYQLYFRKEAERLKLVREHMITLEHVRMFSRTWKVCTVLLYLILQSCVQW